MAKRKRRPKHVASRGPVSAKSARQPGRSHEPRISANTGTGALNTALVATEGCNAKPKAAIIWMVGENKDQEKYSFPVEVGDVCGQPAIVTRRRDGKTERRCAKHIGI